MDIKLVNSHDRFFKSVFSDKAVVKNFFENYIPREIMKKYDLDTLKLKKDSFVNGELKEYFSDLLFEVESLGKREYVYFLFEHKSYKDGNVTVQMLTYVLEIWRKKGKNEKLPIVFPIVFYHGKEKWEENLCLEDKIYGYDELSPENKRYVPRYEVFLFNVSDMTDEEIKGVAKLKWTLMIFRDIMRISGELLEKRLVSIYREVHQDEDYYLSILTYVVNVKEDFNKENIRVLAKDIGKIDGRGGKMAMTLAQTWMAEGKMEGKAEGKAEFLIKVLNNRFGTISKKLEMMIFMSDSNDLEKVLDKIFVMESIEEVERILR